MYSLLLVLDQDFFCKTEPSRLAGTLPTGNTSMITIHNMLMKNIMHARVSVGPAVRLVRRWTSV
jgi:hypothetical protein